ncbi:hypothetical protein LV82_01069 [Albidovulum inexpectatum]|uniref:CTP synthetase n=1 Tax=Albidovulum inexpectatum TaxID=196587 RepID=A0A2S5JK90_9RHOB|nr:hypothetical protein [Albidovulum inexpectatum]PPB81852.1 hypothetical protein LV82_01069 [Albidovulum inexpectatum]
MLRLFFIIYTLAGVTLAGAGIIAVLTVGMVDMWSIIVAAAIGALLAVPVAWVVARRLESD